MLRISLSDGSTVTKIRDELYSVLIKNVPVLCKSIRLESYELDEQANYLMYLHVDSLAVACVLITKEDFLNIYHAIKPEVVDVLNVLGIAKVKTADTDQVPAAGTNNAIS
ncbi:hypothetical protein [Alteromonas sp. C1M14]|uniref:hypothetical protein n=1 Tax=Alteromonas sp. C1M14 TaxID=2841567 RepID=UPI001C08BBD1|nr:hypothetical protein [Alteromonas sp. C1M14]MBU2979039.1 hypothetical protein [Alteromonas sp. C1M14]